MVRYAYKTAYRQGITHVCVRTGRPSVIGRGRAKVKNPNADLEANGLKRPKSDSRQAQVYSRLRILMQGYLVFKCGSLVARRGICFNQTSTGGLFNERKKSAINSRRLTPRTLDDTKTMADKRILLIGTYDTKESEMRFIERVVREQGAAVLTMDVSVLGNPSSATDITKHDVALAAGMSIENVIAEGDENKSFQVMSQGAATLSAELYNVGRFDAMLAIGGTMGTDLALDCAQALPLGVPKIIASTVSFSPLIPAHRLAPDIQMILWAGGLHGLNSICQSSLSQAAGAVVGAANAAMSPNRTKPLIGMTSLGSSCLTYMKTLTPALEERGFEVAVFHSTGMGGMAFEKLAGQGAFACVMDFCMQEFVNMMAGSLVTSGDDRLTNAGRVGTPQMVAPGALDLVDFAGWQEIPPQYSDRPFHEHNRLVKSSAFNADERREWIKALSVRLQKAKGPTHFFLPLHGVEEWDRPGGETHDPDGLAALIDEVRKSLAPKVSMSEVDAHINDVSFSDAVLEVFDDWVGSGKVVTSSTC